MNGPDLHDFLAPVRLSAVEQLIDLMNRVKVADLTTPEVLGLMAVFECADARINAGMAPELVLAPRNGEVSP
jgi:hypothetical protein